MNWYKTAYQDYSQLRSDIDAVEAPKITANKLFYEYILPTTKRLYPNFPVEHYSLSAFLNMSREDTGLDNRRRDNDPTFVNAGTQIKALTNKCISLYGQEKQFKQAVTELVHRLHKWYFEESPSGGLVERPNRRQIDYKKLYELGIKLTPQQGKMLSRVNQKSPQMQSIRNEFMDAHDAMDSGDNQPMIDWWTQYGNSLPTPVVENAKPRTPAPTKGWFKKIKEPVVQEPEYEEIYDWKTDKYIKEPKKMASIKVDDLNKEDKPHSGVLDTQLLCCGYEENRREDGKLYEPKKGKNYPGGKNDEVPEGPAK